MILNELKHTDIALFVAAFLLYKVNIALTTVRLDMLLKGEKIVMPFIKLLELTYIGFFFNNFMPSAIGGDIVKAYYTGQITKQKAQSYVSVFMDRLTGLFSFAGIGLIALIVNWNVVSEPAVKKSVIAFVAICFFIIFIALNRPMAKFINSILSKVRIRNIGAQLMKIYNMLHSYNDKKSVLFKTIMISLVSQVVYFSVIYILFCAMGLNVSYKYVFLTMPIVCVISLLPSLGGLGLREGAMVAFFGAVVGRESAFGVSVLLLGILFLISLIGGIIYAMSPQFRMENLREADII